MRPQKSVKNLEKSRKNDLLLCRFRVIYTLPQGETTLRRTRQ
uniref:Uncharacterized protein n=1 Tax=Siphoviridae sp. ctUi914 TaxID=2825529 RepID=A0A8S5TXH7_9CAUD|nr:MAG TPA: hypothetical protein [Siphoviridae sp. ctUi914]